MMVSSAPLRILRAFARTVPSTALLLAAITGCAGGGSDTQDTQSSQTDGDTEGSTTAETSGTTASETTSTVTTESATDTDTDTDTGGELVTPDLYCPGDPSGICDAVPGAQLMAGAAVVSIIPNCWERWIDENDDAKYEATKDTLLDCGCDQLCPDDVGYQGPDEGENDGEIQGIWLAGFGNGRAATGIRTPEMGLVGAGDGWDARSVVLGQGNTTVAIVTVDTIGYFNDEVVEIRKMLAADNVKVDHVVVQALHNHEGPDTMGMWGQEFLQPGYDEAYGEQVREAIVEAISLSVADMRPVQLMTVGEVDISTYHENGLANVIRDSRDPWVVDEMLSAVRLVAEEEKTIATLVSYGCHPETLADDNTLITADFVHALRRTVEEGSVWETAPGKEGFGGPAIFINAAVGGMMTTLGVEVTNPDGDTYKSASFEKADSIGQLLGEMAIDAIELGEVLDAPELSVANTAFKVDVVNPSFKLLFEAGVLKRTTYPSEEGGDELRIQTEMSVINLGPVQMLSIPGEILPELVIGGYDGSRVNAPGVPLVDPENPNPPDLDNAPEGPYIQDRMGGTYRWIIGLGNDELGYIIPDYNFELAQGNPYVDEAEGDHYEETNSLGPHVAGLVDRYADELTQWSAAMLGQ